ncbi:hypothetical protein H5410_044643 [Solanum commersonii]|uniref:KIB1-4 beta-propeller domain-containing protein n=1 Tax=Solanum commersonii TaxID=4109 RepID=A0A9J5X7D9_SOLCO|nr:hypothetical protein H5410_044643 [Solanum commersonii]
MGSNIDYNIHCTCILLMHQVECNPQLFMLQKRMPQLCIQPEVQDQDNHLVREMGHVKEKCYKLIGYPENFKGKKRAHVATHPLAGLNLGYNHGPQATEHGVGVGPAPVLTQHQYNQIVQMLNKCSIGNTGANMGGNSNYTANTASANTANTAGTFFSHIDDSVKWVVDTGATNHMIGDKSVLQTGTSIDDTGKKSLAVQKEVDAALWHRRMGHAPIDVHFNEHVFPFEKKLAHPDTRNQVSSPVSVDDFDLLFDVESVISPVRQSTDNAIQPTDANVQENADDVRKSHRSIRPPLWHKDFVMTNNKRSCQYPISNVMSYTDILKSISSHLVAGDYFVFHAVCKPWREHPLPPQLHLHHDDSPSPFLMTLHKETGIVEFFNSVYNALIIPTMVISKLKGSTIRSSKANWLLMSHGNRGMFFFNPKSNDIIELPDLPSIHNCFSAWTFSCPLDSSSSSCFVVGFDEVGSLPGVYIIKVGDTTWTYHYFLNELRNCQGLFSLLGCDNLVFFKNTTVCVLGELGDKGTLEILTIKQNSAAETPSWQFYGTPFSCTKQKSIREVYMVEDVDNRGMLAVFLTHEQGKVEPLAVGETNVNFNTKAPYEAILKLHQMTKNLLKTILKSIEFIHGVPNVRFTMEEKEQFAREEGVH